MLFVVLLVCIAGFYFPCSIFRYQSARRFYPFTGRNLDKEVIYWTSSRRLHHAGIVTRIAGTKAQDQQSSKRWATKPSIPSGAGHYYSNKFSEECLSPATEVSWPGTRSG